MDQDVLGAEVGVDETAARAGPAGGAIRARPARRSRGGPGRSSGRTGRSGADRRRPYRRAGHSTSAGWSNVAAWIVAQEGPGGAGDLGLGHALPGAAPSRRPRRPERRSSRTGSSRGRRRGPRGRSRRAGAGPRHSSAACSVQIRSSRLTQCARVRSRSRACLSTNGGWPSTSTRMTTFETPQPRPARRPSPLRARAPSRGGNRRPSRGSLHAWAVARLEKQPLTNKPRPGGRG